MKIDARVQFINIDVAKSLGKTYTKILVDMDYVSADSSEVTEWVRNELEKMFGHSFSDEDFEIVNMDEILEELTYDEFLDKTTV